MNANQHAPRGELPPGLSVSGMAPYDKSGVLIDYARRFHVKTLVETGLYYGNGSGMPVYLGGHVDNYVAIDWQQDNLDRARQAVPQGEYYCGDSAWVLRAMLDPQHVEPKVRSYFSWDDLSLPVLFWLDAHALTEDEGSPTICPVLGELDAVGAWEHAATSVMLIDDLWGMGQVRGWPTLDELRERAASFEVWEIDEAGGIMRLTPKP